MPELNTRSCRQTHAFDMLRDPRSLTASPNAVIGPIAGSASWRVGKKCGDRVSLIGSLY
jgi:hypothetical protein